MSAGRNDPIVPPSNTRELAELLRAAGADVELRWKDGGHDLRQDEVDAARTWLRADPA
jgi:phospholipase/carboxylesterase